MADQDGVIRFANPSAVTALGFDSVSELIGKPSHQTIHYKRPDGSPFPADECPLLLPRTTGETIHRADDWFVRRDGSMFPVEYWSAPMDGPGGRGAVVAFPHGTRPYRTPGKPRQCGKGPRAQRGVVRLCGDHGIRGHEFRVQEEMFIRALQLLGSRNEA